MGKHTEGAQEKEAVDSSQLWLRFIGFGQAFFTLSLKKISAPLFHAVASQSLMNAYL